MVKIHKIVTCLMIGTLALATKAAVAQASEEPVAGIDLVLQQIYQSPEPLEEKIVKYLPSEYDNLAFAKVTNYVNIRSKDSEDSQIVGKLYNNSAATIIAKKGDWYQIKSGSVSGYIKSEFLVTGDGAAQLAQTVGSRLATVTTTTLKVREKSSTASAVVTLVPIGEELKVLKEQEGWVKVSVSGDIKGYVSSDYVKLQTVYEEAVSIEEEQERLREEAAANNRSSGESTKSKVSSPERTVALSNNSSLGSKIATYAVQFVGNPYVWGGTSLTNGADCSGFTQSVFAHFGISIPRTSRTQAAGGRKVSMDNLSVGDLIFYARNGTINHVAIYIGGGRVISASSPETGIRITSYNYRPPYKAVTYIN